MKTCLLSIIALLVICQTSIAQQHQSGKIIYSKAELAWADSVLKTLTTREKIAQLFAIPVYSNKTRNYKKLTVEDFAKNQYGCIIFMQGGPVRQALLHNRIQDKLKVPAMVAMDAEYGLGMRLDSTITYPRAMALSATNDTNLLYRYGIEIGRQCQRLGVHINFAPVIDINNNPKNPVIGNRSFGEDKDDVTNCAIAFANGLQSTRVMAVGKHFPGHGDTHTDSHIGMPIIKHNIKYLNNNELYPFYKTSNLMGGMMIAHISLPAIEPDTTIPATLSPLIVKQLLKEKIGYKGLIFTDALNMRAVSTLFSNGELEMQAFLAGNDIIVFPQDVNRAFMRFEDALKKGTITIDELNQRCLKVLRAKAWFGLNNYKPIDTLNLYNDINNSASYKLQDEIIKKSLTLVKNDNDIIPFKNLQNRKFLSICIGGTVDNTFNKTVKLYTNVDTLLLPKKPNYNAIKKALEKSKEYDNIIIATLATSESLVRNFGITPEVAKLIDTLALQRNAVLVHMGNPYSLAKLTQFDKLQAVLVGYRAIDESNQLAAEAIFGGNPITGVLPVSINNKIKKGFGIKIEEKSRLSYTYNHNADKHNKYFNKVDSIIEYCIKSKIMPGCQIIFGVDGEIVYRKAFGYHTYDSIQAVKETDLYDIASITKIAATTTALMQLYDKHKFNLSDPLSQYVPMLKTSNKTDTKIDQILTHQAGFTNWIPFYRNTIDNGKPKLQLYSNVKTKKHSIQIADSLFLLTTYRDTIYREIINSPIAEEKKYFYSDLGFYLFPQMIENLSKQKFEQYCSQNIYKPIGMTNTCFLPREKVDLNRIIPSEIDTEWRNNTIKGFVNDQGAAMLGGISGHAGLFSNADDIAKLCQMWLNNGWYGDHTFFAPSTMTKFTTAPFINNDNRRAMGFDKPLIKYDINGPTCETASQESYGHTGYTGSFVWADPKHNCFMVFLTNRTFPSVKNNKLAKENIRPQIQDILYQYVQDLKK